MTPAIFFVLVGMFFAGLLLLWLGRRGRKLNDHPVCRQCGFDLDGVYPSAATCPECGAGLKQAGFVKTGVRRRMPAVMLAGALIALVPVAPIAVVLYASVTGADINKYKPLGLLLWEATHAAPARRPAIAGELYNRMLAKSLDADQTRGVIEKVLAMQADHTQPWDEAWGALIERAKLDGTLTTEQESLFRDQVPVFEASVRPRVAAGDPLPICIEVKERRLAPSHTFLSMVDLAGLKVGDQPVRVGSSNIIPNPLVSAIGSFFSGSVGNPTQMFYLVGTKSQFGMMGGDAPRGTWVLTLPQDVKPGIHTIELDLRVAVNEVNMGAPAFNAQTREELKTAIRLRTTVEVTPADATSVQAIEPTEELARDLATRLRPQQAHTQEFEIVGRMKQTHLSMQFSVESLPAPIAFNVFLRHDGRETPMGELTSGQSADRQQYFPGMGDIRHVNIQIPKLKSKRVDIVLKPNLGLAKSTLDLTKVYNGEITIKNVQISEMNGFVRTVTGSSLTGDEDEEEKGEDGKDPP